MENVRNLNGNLIIKKVAKHNKEYLEEEKTGIIRIAKYKKYTIEQKIIAVDYYLEHGRNLCRTIKNIGYPSRDLLKKWC